MCSKCNCLFSYTVVHQQAFYTGHECAEIHSELHFPKLITAYKHGHHTTTPIHLAHCQQTTNYTYLFPIIHRPEITESIQSLFVM